MIVDQDSLVDKAEFEHATSASRTLFQAFSKHGECLVAVAESSR
jgi:hypothetical protein